MTAQKAMGLLLFSRLYLKGKNLASIGPSSFGSIWKMGILRRHSDLNSLSRDDTVLAHLAAARGHASEVLVAHGARQF